MPTRTALTLVEAAVAGGNGALPSEVKAQAAFVRALVDEVERFHPGDRDVVALHHQLGDELALLARQLERGAAQAGVLDAPAPIEVLVVDDEIDARQAAATVVRALGYACRMAADAEEALRLHAQKAADIILADWHMPGMSGLDLCTVLKEHEPQPYVILASGFHENARLLEGMRGGADDFLRKPFTLEELEVRLAAAARLLHAVRMVAEMNTRIRAQTAAQA